MFLILHLPPPKFRRWLGMKTTMKTMLLSALFGLWFAHNPIPTWAASLPAGVSDQVVFSGSQIGNTPQTFTFDDSAESQPGFFQVTVPSAARIAGAPVFGLIETSCNPLQICQFSDILSVATTPGESDTQTLTFSFQSDTEATITPSGSLSSCLEASPPGTAGCGVDAAITVVSANGILLSANISSDADIPGVPEPSTVLLVGPGLAGVAVWGRKSLQRI
jgi:hypothetical protein